ncbi:MFS transporter (plasmid) [Citricoccus sp. SGAir0253]|uniref:MFS transporter n=1 Tax=Citricoccus sp. SGAir0253 TaxID=2567881 RepID=UPI0010CCFB3F|nr:MFS transporter [Citricoccus sp. SGAir0253]QCU79593.1 MFS transporter [Citricoccus sp. SGAir0253]
MAGLLLAAATGGAALALSTSVTNGLVARYVHVDHRGRLIATKQIGVQVAQMAAGLALPLAAASVGWRQGMLAGALGVLVLLVPSVLALRTATGPLADATRPARSSVGATATARPRHLTPMMFGYGMLTGVCFQAVLFGLPPTGLEELGLDLPVASLAVMALGVAGFAARFGWGFVADRFTNLLTLMVALGLALAASSGAVLLSMGAHSLWAYWAGAVLCGAGFALVPVVLSSAVLRYFPPERVGLVSGVVTASTFLGFAGGPVLFGATVDELGYPAAWWGLLVAGLLSSLIPLVFSVRRRPRGAPAP